MKLTDLVNGGELLGYHPGYPPRNPVSLVDGPEIDGEIAESQPCPECGSKMEYRPYVADKPHQGYFGMLYSYRAFAVCTLCGEAVEF